MVMAGCQRGQLLSSHKHYSALSAACNIYHPPCFYLVDGLSHFSIRRSWRNCACRQSSRVVALDVFACLLLGRPSTSSTSSAAWEVWIGQTPTLTLVCDSVTSTILHHIPLVCTQSSQLFMRLTLG